MPFRKIDEPADARRACPDPAHNPPTMIVLPPGRYEYDCPTCGHSTPVVVERPTLQSAIDAVAAAHLARFGEDS